MAQRYIDQAGQALAGTYGTEQNMIQSQLPAVAQLYQTLVGALQDTGAQATGSVMESAARRGLNRGTLAEDLAAALAPNMAVGQAQLNVDRTAQDAEIAGNLATLGMGRLSSTQQLAGSLQDRELDAQKHNMRMQELERENEIAIKTHQAREARARAEAARAARAKKNYDFYDAFLTRHVGGDGKVSPDKWKEAMASWVSKYGPDSSAEFITKFGGYMNKSHIKDYFTPMTIINSKIDPYVYKGIDALKSLAQRARK